LRPRSAAGHRDRLLIRRERARDADAIRAITTAAFAPGQPAGQLPAEAQLVILGAADALGEPLAVLLGDPGYYRRFGFRLSTDYQITPPRPHWQPHFQVRVLSGYQPRVHGMFTYAEPFDLTE
jgi:putative acetyltransferase